MIRFKQAVRVKATVLCSYLQVTQESWPNQKIPVLLLSPHPIPQEQEYLYFPPLQSRSYLLYQLQCQNR